ncbi:ectonucleotide pyrophosphatase/phosphodiesterase [Opitutus sp. ER46]|uniref:alkaline phosphatase family protein n=1 Tax=Opitutus sp. ER46 TaxID=2161864 RepID=UPI000D327FC7|nr:ectonucleotide pyrophosphatase/phosphodiesterase [Opitutus sp. ER46]PTX97936.1 alkaline phosphatase family protein [Opitutus sp. ER46]
MRLLLLLFVLALPVSRAAAAVPSGAAAVPSGAAETAHATVLLISMDGFRWDYLNLYPQATPVLRRLAREGVTARGLVPVFPSNTFPNHYAIATGLYPSHHGIINNRMVDPQLGVFVSSKTQCAEDGRWWGGEPVWITAVKQGRTSACYFWPGSEAPIAGLHATHWKPYDYSIPFARRLDELIGWLKVPAPQRPAVATFYFEESNSSGHRYGPDSPELQATLKTLDAQLGTMLARFQAENLPINLVILSDHGMTPCGPDRVLLLDDYVDLTKVAVDFADTACGLRPAPGVAPETILAALGRMPHAKAYRSADLPARLHVDPANPRVPGIWILPDEGWLVQRRAAFAAARNHFVKAQHGYDPALPSMHGILIAHGPAFRRGVTLPEVENVHVYNLLCAAAGLKPAANDGDDRLVKSALLAP